MTILGAWHARRVRTAEDFALAGRRLGAPVLAGTLIATWVGTGSIFGFAQKAFEHGVTAFVLPLSGLTGMLLLAWIAPRVREIPASSVPEILGLRFGGGARRLGAVALLGAYLIIVSYQYRAGAAVAHRMFPDLPETGLYVGFAAFVILYTALAGLVSVALTDVVNGAVMVTGILAALVWMYWTWDPGRQPVPEAMATPDFPPTRLVNWLLPGFLLVLGDANLQQRFLAARTPATARRAAFLAFGGLLVLESSIVLLAFLSRVRLPAEILERPGYNPAHVIVDAAFHLVPTGIGVFIAAAVVAVIVSTADSFLLACSTTAATDLGGGMTTPLRQRLLVLLLGLLALGMAFLSNRFFEVALVAYTIYGATLTPAVACALLWPDTPPRAVLAGMAAGLGTVVVWEWLWPWLLPGVAKPGLLGELDSVLPALCMNLAVLLLVQAASRRRPA